jgi:hypothetical protein
VSVLISVDVKNQTPEGYDSMLPILVDLARKAPGFIVHCAYETEDGAWRVIEIWETKSDANRFFADHVAPNLPPGVRPKRQVHELHSVIRRRA